MADDGKKIVRLIQHKGKVVLQKAVLPGAPPPSATGGGQRAAA